MKFALIFTALLAILSACAKEPIQKQIPVEPKSKALINGTPVDLKDPQYWPTVRIRTGNSGCTATVVGKWVLLTASHCVSDGATSKFSFKGVDYSAKMTRSPVYPHRDNDIALGLLDKEFAAVPTSIDSKRLETEEVVTLAGYGCVKAGGGGGNDGILRIGDSVVVGRTTYDTVTREPGGAALCYGDSGGPLFKDKKLVGVNSKGNISTTSYLSRLDISYSQDFLSDWSKNNKAEICGFNAKPDDCGAPPIPPPPPVAIVLENKYYKTTIELKEGNPHSASAVEGIFNMVMDYLLKKEPPMSRAPEALILEN